MPPFDELLERFWDMGETYGVGPPLTNAAISDVERTLGVRLPRGWRFWRRRRG